jgi:hypothetical protein
VQTTTTWDRFSKWLDEKKLGAIMIVLALIPMFVPIAIPMTISPFTQAFYDEIVARPSGEVVVTAFDLTMPAPRASATYNVAILDFLCRRGLKLLMLSFGTQSAQAWAQFMTYVQPDKKYGYVYGRDWALMPYLAGEETAFATIAGNLRVFTTDYFGNTVADLQIMQGISSMKDITLAVVTAGTFTLIDAMVRQWPSKYSNLRVITYYQHATASPYEPTLIKGDLDWVNGHAQFESLTGFKGEELILLTARNMLIILVMSTVIVGNIFFHINKRQKARVPTQGQGVSNQ